MHELALCCLMTKTAEADGHVATYDGDIVDIELNEPLQDREIGDAGHLTVFDPVRGLCRYSGLLGGIDGTTVQLVVLERGEPDQRRSAARAYYRADCIAKVETGDATYALGVTVVDVSASGVRFVTPRVLQKGDLVRFSMPTGDESVDLAARVLRIEEGAHEWRYGCELVDLPNRTREALFRLVLKLQRAAARERSGIRT